MRYLCTVTRVLATFLFLSYLFSATEFRQLVKVPSLVDHYAEHKANDSGISFFGFLYMHYAGDDLVDTDNDRDMALPFKNFDNAPASGPGSIPPAFIDLLEAPDSTPDWTCQIQVDQGLGCFTSIWQPPRLSA